MSRSGDPIGKKFGLLYKFVWITTLDLRYVKLRIARVVAVGEAEES